MNRQQKEVLVDIIKKDFVAAHGVYVLGYKGASVSAMQSLRRKLRESGAALRVVKMRLAKRAVMDNGDFAQMTPYLREQCGVVFAYQDPIVVAKVLDTCSKDCDKIQIVVGRVENELLDPRAVQYLATLPSRDVLLMQLLGMMQSPVVQTVCLCNTMLVRLLFVLKLIAQKRESEA